MRRRQSLDIWRRLSDRTLRPAGYTSCGTLRTVGVDGVVGSVELMQIADPPLRVPRCSVNPQSVEPQDGDARIRVQSGQRDP
jgi:hypothetical protein